MDDTSLLKIKIRVEQLITEREGMIADNKQREFQGQAMAYVEEQFLKLREALQGELDFLLKYG